MLLVRLNLVERFPDVCGFVGWVLEFKQHQRQAVDKQDDVGSARVMRPFDRELVDGQPVIALGCGPVDQANIVAACLTVLLVLHRHPGDQQSVELPVGREQCRVAQVKHLLERVFTGSSGDARVELEDRFTQSKRQQHLPIVAALGRIPVWRDVRPEQGRVSGLCQPAQCFLFKLVFGHCVGLRQRSV